MTRRHGNGRIRRRGFGAFFLLLAVLAAAGCGERSDIRIARRILENHRHRAGVKPLPGAQVVRLKLFSPPEREAAEGTGQIEWDGSNYRETVSSAGCTTVRGIQAGKAYLTDEDGVTRVTSEPALSELLTRSYFWRRAYLFDDLENARIALGPADTATVSVRLIPRGGHPLLLIFSNRGDLIGARSPRFRLEFRGPRRLTDASRPGAPVETEILSITLPVDQMSDAQAGGWSARWPAPSAEAEWTGASLECRSESPSTPTPMGRFVFGPALRGDSDSLRAPTCSDGGWRAPGRSKLERLLFRRCGSRSPMRFRRAPMPRRAACSFGRPSSRWIRERRASGFTTPRAGRRRPATSAD